MLLTQEAYIAYLERSGDEVLMGYVAMRERAEAAESRVAGLEADLRAAVEALTIVTACYGGICDGCRRRIAAVLARPTIAALREVNDD